MIGQHPQNIATISGTDADYLYRPRRTVVQRRGYLRLNDAQPRLQAGKILILFQPLVPVRAHGQRKKREGSKGLKRRSPARIFA